jgi:hypothetical protein
MGVACVFSFGLAGVTIGEVITRPIPTSWSFSAHCPARAYKLQPQLLRHRPVQAVIQSKSVYGVILQKLKA